MSQTPSWLDDFLTSYAYSINNKKQSIEDVVKKYREQVGLDLVNAEDEAEEQVKTSETITTKKASKHFISKRAKQECQQCESIVDLIKSNENLMKLIESHCQHSGGNKNHFSIINQLKQHSDLQDKLVSYKDEELIDLIKQIQSQHKHTENCKECNDPGKVGIDTADDFSDNAAEYATRNNK